MTNSISQTVVADKVVHSHVTRDEEEEDLEYTKLDNGFYAILGSVHGASTIRMFMDHQQVFCFKTV